MDLSPFLIGPSHTLMDGLRRLEASSEGILLLVDERGRLLRTVTDGDLRRLLLRGAALTDPLASLEALRSRVAAQGTTAPEALDLMNAWQIDHLPEVDADGRVCGLFLRRELDAKILLSTPHLSEYEMGFVEEAFRSNWIAPLGPNVDAFENELAQHVGIAHAAALASGTAGLHLALRLLGVKPGDTVICSSLTFVASTNPILYEGASPVFIDAEPGSWNMSPAALERALRDADRSGRLPRAVIVVNLYGQSADMDPLLALCARYDIPVIEDAAESLGATYRGRSSGTFGRIGVFSFNGNKIITTSGGGMLVSDLRELVEKARFLSTQAREPAPWYEHAQIGYNYRMSNVLAGIGRGQLRVLQDRVAARRQIFARYVEGLDGVRGLSWMPEAGFGQSTRWLSVATLDPEATGVTPATLIAQLSRFGIEARHVWKPMHLQPLFAGRPYYPHAGDASFSDRAFATGVCLPSGSNLTEDQQRRIVRCIRTVLGSDR